ncbi:MAG: UbiA prenyltransferase family protein [Candidatus Competibacteraceae bacterium]|jgi:4-hydroxybenzoate polyprenyltransferase|nr:UbiA prenyltransferase family protein [Candidatus Competibacteraceae bacterium]
METNKREMWLWGRLHPYIRIARFDHWFKNVFMLPGLALAWLLVDVPAESILTSALIALLSTGFIASANYVINEWLDAEFDRHHPIKRNRPSASGSVRGRYVFIEYLLFVGLGMGLASLLNPEFVFFSWLLLMMGVLYNVRPFRTKDRILLDVISESVNNPIRLLLGWSAIISGRLPPSSILLSYWMGGAFLMAMKRYAEYRFIDNPESAALYRRSFRFYTEETLLLSSFFYAILSAFFLGIFLIKYRIEFILSLPFFTLLYVWYLHIAMKRHSASQAPERLYQEPVFVGYVFLLGLIVVALFVIDIPWLNILVEPLSY